MDTVVCANAGRAAVGLGHGICLAQRSRAVCSVCFKSLVSVVKGVSLNKVTLKETAPTVWRVACVCVAQKAQ